MNASQRTRAAQNTGLDAMADPAFASHSAVHSVVAAGQSEFGSKASYAQQAALSRHDRRFMSDLDLPFSTQARAADNVFTGSSQPNACRQTLIRSLFLVLPLCFAPLHAATFSVSTVPEMNAAIQAANSNGEPDVIEINASLLATAVGDTSNGPSAFAAITSVIEVDGNGHGIESSLSPQKRFFRVAPGGALTLRDITLNNGRNGGAEASAILVEQGALQLSQVVVQKAFASGTAAPQNRGAIVIRQPTQAVIIERSRFLGNSSSEANDLWLAGGSMTITDSEFLLETGTSVWLSGNASVALARIQVNNANPLFRSQFMVAQGASIDARDLNLRQAEGFSLRGASSLDLATSQFYQGVMLEVLGTSVANLQQVRSTDAAIQVATGAQLRAHSSTFFNESGASSILDVAGALELINVVAEHEPDFRSGTPTIRYSLFESQLMRCPTGVGNICVSASLSGNVAGQDGVFGTMDDDYRLPAGSLGINSGEATERLPDTDDLDGDGDLVEPIPLDARYGPRVVGSAMDRGAIESTPMVIIRGADSLRVSEATAVLPDVMLLKLDREPSDVVVISASADGQCLPQPAQFVFHPPLRRTPQSTPWSVEQTMEIRAIDDAFFEGAHECLITLTATSNDPNFSGSVARFAGRGLLQPNQVRVTVQDNDLATDDVFVSGFE